MNTKVNLIDQTTKAGWSRGTLFIERERKRDALRVLHQVAEALNTDFAPLSIELRRRADDAVLLPTLSKLPRLTPDERIEYFQHFLADRPSGKLDSLHLSPGCNTMTMAGLYTFNFAVNGKQVPARYTFTYRWDGQAWLISHHHSSLLPQG